MSSPNLNHADTLCWIAKLGTFSAAAERMHTTQPAVSARMRELESSLGYALFEKRGRRMELTLQARRFVERVEPLLRSVEDAFNDSDAVSNPSGTVRFGIGEVGVTWLGRLMRVLRETLPRVTYDIELDLGVKLQEQVVDGTLDMAIVANSRQNSELVYTPIGRAPMIWVCAKSLLRTSKGHDRPLDELLRGETLWCMSKPSDFFAPAYDTLRSAGANMSNLCSCNKLKGLIDVVSSGGGIALLPQTMISHQLQTGHLAAVPGHLEGQFLDFAVAIHRNQMQSVVHRLVAELVRLSTQIPIGSHA